MTTPAKAVKVEEFDEQPPDHGRPCIAAFTGDEGRVALHVERDSGRLWLFVAGPAGGERGRLAFGTGRADAVREWVDGDRTGVLAGGTCWLTLRGDVLHVRRARHSRGWSMRFDDAALTVFVRYLREWSRAVR